MAATNPVIQWQLFTHGTDLMTALGSEQQIVSAAGALGAATVPELSEAERALLRNSERLDENLAEQLRRAIRLRHDPLGEAFTSQVRTPEQRRKSGATYTPPVIVDAMVNWARRFHRQSYAADPERIVDPGAGSGRFLVAAGRKFPAA